MLMTLFFILLAAYFIVRGGREAGLWALGQPVEGFLMLASGVCLLLAQLL